MVGAGRHRDSAEDAGGERGVGVEAAARTTRNAAATGETRLVPRFHAATPLFSPTFSKSLLFSRRHAAVGRGGTIQIRGTRLARGSVEVERRCRGGAARSPPPRVAAADAAAAAAAPPLRGRLTCRVPPLHASRLRGAPRGCPTNGGWGGGRWSSLLPWQRRWRA